MLADIQFVIKQFQYLLQIYMGTTLLWLYPFKPQYTYFGVLYLEVHGYYYHIISVRGVASAVSLLSLDGEYLHVQKIVATTSNGVIQRLDASCPTPSRKKS